MDSTLTKPQSIRSGLVKEDPGYAAELEYELRRAIEGEVRFDAGSRGAYSADASNYRQIPIGVVVPRTVDDVVETVSLCHKYGAPITSRGGGTSLAGQCVNVAIVIDWSKYLNHVVSVDGTALTAVVEPGCVLDTLRKQAQSEYGLTFGPDPATHSHNTLGGMIGNNSCGIHSVMAQLYGPGPTTEHQVESLEILTYDGQRMTVGPTSKEEIERFTQQGGRRGEIYRQLHELSRQHADLIRARYPDIPRRVSGYNLTELLPGSQFNVARALVGSEGTCVTVLQATVKLMKHQAHKSLVVLGYPSVFKAADHVTQIMSFRPVGLEGIDETLVHYMRLKGLHPQDVKLLPDGKGWLLVEFGGDTPDEARDKAQQAAEAVSRESDAPTVKVFTDPWEEKKLWEVRESGLGATAHVPGLPEAYPGWEDAAVPPENVGNYLREFRKLLDEFDYDCALYGHFGQGCVHCRIPFDLKTTDGIAKYVEFVDRAADLVVKQGGSLSGEHGDGQSCGALLEKMYGAELVDVFRQFKRIWDPQGKMNPGKVVDPYPPDSNLRLSPQHYHPGPTVTHFSYLRDDGSFAEAANRCVGVGKCRREEGGTMCPSYMVTREEIHSTRGRSRLLFEMLQGDVVADGWYDEHVHEALDLCLACKGCKNECPVNVDMATYKAEFLSHYYERHRRPRTAYAMGWIYWWARLASHAPRIANAFSQTWPLSVAAKLIAGISLNRKIPPFAHQTFVDWFRTRRSRTAARPERQRRSDYDQKGGNLRHGDVPDFQSDTYDDRGERNLNPYARKQRLAGKRVLLWPDTFTNYLRPSAGKAAVRVLEEAGYEVTIPSRPLCCGRPLYDYGMLDEAKRLWMEILHALRDEIAADTPLVGLEPSCVAAFRDELINLFPGEGPARQLSENTYLLSEFLARQDYEPPPLHRKALVHGHCHHKAVMQMDAEVALLKKMELDYELLDSGCCGMAGSFGFESEKYDVSIAAGERVLLPAVRQAESDTLIITNGFSCREQIEQCTNRHALHVAEVLSMALDEEGLESESPDHPSSQYVSSRWPAAVAVGAGLATGLAIVHWITKSRNS